jgi:hypothetical protein
MARVRLNPYLQRSVETKKTYLGKTILFCEGKTEYNYFDYFADIIKRNGDKYSHIELKLITAEGNAQTVLNHANDFLENEGNSLKYTSYDKYLVFDSDDPPNIKEVLKDMKESEHSYILLLSNLLFETWLLMHFEILDSPLKKRKIYEKLADKLGYDNYVKHKSSPGMIRQIIGNCDSVRNAIKNAKELEKTYGERNYNYEECIDSMNPYTTVHQLVEKLIE